MVALGTSVRLWFVAVVAGVLPLAVGCGGSGPEIVPASGQVLIDGEPLATGIAGFVQVIPADGRPATGNIDPQTGRFTLSTLEKDDGCIKGTHKVVVIMQQMVGQESESLVPVRYTEPEMTDLSVTIDGPTDALKIELTGPLKPAKAGAQGPVEDDPNKF